MSIQDSQHLDPEARILSLGDTPSVQAGSNDWVNAWSKRGVTATHKANLTNALEAWSAVKYTNLLATTLLGGDIAAGALGVGGQSAATSAVRQEIDGKEALRFTLGEPASAVSISLASFFANDDGTAYAEGARVRLFDGAGAMVGQGFVFATQASGKQLVQLASNQPFVTVELSAGALDASGAFVHGAYTDAQGAFATAIFSNASGAHGSDFLVEQVVFEFARPKAAGDAYQATEDGGVQAFSSVLANDRDAAGAALSAELQFSPEHGTLSLNADGSFTYVADPDYFGDDSFSYRAFNGKDYSDPVIVELHVRSVNDGPAAADDSDTVYQGGHASLIDVLANDKAGPANEAGQVLAITAASAANGTAWVREDGQLLYVPDAGFTGTDTIR